MTSVSHEFERSRDRAARFTFTYEDADFGAAVRRIALFTVVIAIASLPAFAPTIGHSEVRVIVPALAILCFAFTWLPRREAPIYALIYAVISIGIDYSSATLGFDTAETVIQIAEALALALLVPRHLTRRQMIAQTVRVILYIAAALLISLIGASLSILVAGMSGLTRAGFAEELGGSASLAWRYWWLGHACGYVTITGTLTFLRQTTRSDWVENFGNPHERRTFIAYTIGHTLVALLVLPPWDMSGLGLPSDVRLALSFMPIMTSIAMTGRFKGFGTSAAILIATAVAITSVAGPNAARNWVSLPSMITPVYFALMSSTAVCWVLAINLRRLQWATRDALEASEMKSRFIAMLNHELRTPLNAILGFSELMRLKSVRALGEAIGPVENIHASGQRLLAMFEGLLGQADHGASVFDLDKQPLPLRTHLQAAIDELKPEFKAHSCKVTLAAPDDLEIDADPRALKQILAVLLGYPLRFCGPGTGLWVSASHRGTDTIVEVCSHGLINATADDRDRLEMQLVNALALAHGARLHVDQTGRTGRLARLTFFATRAAA